MLTNVADPRTRIFTATGGLYFVILLALVAYGAVTFRSLYAEPRRPARLINEDALINTFNERYGETYEKYARFLRAGGVTLAVYLAIWTAAFGVWRKRYWHGIAAVAAGGAATVAALSLLPWM